MPVRKKKRFTYAGGRSIHCDGVPFIGISREGSSSPADVDAAAHKIVGLLNRSRMSCTPWADSYRRSKG